ncbi:MAG TPA: helix-turn-helix domain-containing protein [Stellaceae bacterium]
MNRLSSGATAIPLIIADIYELAGRLRARGDLIAGAIGQSQARWQVLSAASGPPVSVPRIARRLGLSRQAVQRIADLLAADGLAAFAVNPDHKASPNLVLTPVGHDALARLTKTARAGHEELAASLDAVDLAALRRDLRALLAALDASPIDNKGA